MYLTNTIVNLGYHGNIIFPNLEGSSWEGSCNLIEEKPIEQRTEAITLESLIGNNRLWLWLRLSVVINKAERCVLKVNGLIQVLLYSLGVDLKRKICSVPVRCASCANLDVSNWKSYSVRVWGTSIYGSLIYIKDSICSSWDHASLHLCQWGSGHLNLEEAVDVISRAIYRRQHECKIATLVFLKETIPKRDDHWVRWHVVVRCI